MYERSIPFTAYAFIGITSLVVTYSYITSNQEENNEIDNNTMNNEEETQINNVNSTQTNPDLGENVPNFGGKKTKRKTRNKKYKNTKSKRHNSTNKRKYFFF